ncbi:hypothetical protein JCM4914_17950 [Streptomyces platensis subsp. malvinus]
MVLLWCCGSAAGIGRRAAGTAVLLPKIVAPGTDSGGPRTPDGHGTVVPGPAAAGPAATGQRSPAARQPAALTGPGTGRVSAGR